MPSMLSRIGARSQVGAVKLRRFNTHPPSLEQLFTALGVEFNWYMKETSGTTVVNSGTGGANLDGTNVNSIPINQTIGGLGPAYNFDAVNQAIERNTNATLVSLFQANALTVGWLLYPRNPLVGGGGTGFGYLLSFEANGAFKVNFNNSLNSIDIDWHGGTVIGATTTSTGVTQNAWQWVFWRHAKAAAGGDGLMDVFTYRAGALTEATYSSRTAVEGATNTFGLNLIVGNRNNAGTRDRAADAAYRGFFATDQALTDAQLAQIGSLTPL